MMEAFYGLWMTHIYLRPLGKIFQLAAISLELLKIFRKSEFSSQKLPKIEGLNLPWQLQAVGETLSANAIMDKLLKCLVYSYLTLHIG